MVFRWNSHSIGGFFLQFAILCVMRFFSPHHRWPFHFLLHMPSLSLVFTAGLHLVYSFNACFFFAAGREIENREYSLCIQKQYSTESMRIFNLLDRFILWKHLK